jgi:hypothetical protein
MVKLQKHKAYTYRADSGIEIEHYKHLVVIPEEAIQNLGWQEGQELSWCVTSDKLIFATRNTVENSQ